VSHGKADLATNLYHQHHPPPPAPDLSSCALTHSYGLLHLTKRQAQFSHDRHRMPLVGAARTLCVKAAAPQSPAPIDQTRVFQEASI